MTGALVGLRRSRDADRAPEIAARSPRRRVALVSAPFGGIDTPSLALGILAATLRREGHHVEVHHLDLDVVALFGLERYRWVAEDSGWRLMVGEWLAGDERLLPGRATQARFESFLREEGRGPWRRLLGSIDLGELRAKLDGALARFVESRDWGGYDVVGFTVMFQQLSASLRLARAIKDAHPGTRVVLGGINLEGPAGPAVAMSFPWLDAVFTGYADKSFPHWLASFESEGRVIDQGTEPIVLDTVPIPEFGEYFRRLDELGLTSRVRPQVPLEIARGCWWGQKHHCIFCGLNGSQMTFFDKSPERVVTEIRTLKRYGKKLFLVDNILAPRAYDDLLPRLREEGAKLDLRWSASLKANVTRPQLQRLLEAGIDVINPGIESLSTHVLRRMDKGETSVQNVWLLRACRELGVHPEWHLLWGFPGEDPAAYADQAALVPKLTHLPAPLACVQVELVRFSPMQKWPERYGLTRVRAHRAYAEAFGRHPMMADVAYHFEFDHASGVEPQSYARPALDAAERWRSASRSSLTRPRCEAVHVGGKKWLLDTRPGRPGGERRLTAAQWEVLERLERPMLDASLPSEREWRTNLFELERRWLVAHLDGRWVRLVVFPAERSFARRLVLRLWTAIRRRT